jgi:ankyrin repeat protein
MLVQNMAMQMEEPLQKPEHLCWTPLEGAVFGGNEKIVRLLLERGAGVNAPGYDLLENAVKDNRLDIVRMLVEHGAKNEIEGISIPLPGYSDLARLSQMVETDNDSLRQYLQDKLVEYEMAAGAGDAEKET